MSADLDHDPPARPAVARRPPITLGRPVGEIASSPAGGDPTKRPTAASPPPARFAVDPRTLPRQPILLVAALVVLGVCMQVVAMSGLGLGQIAFLALAPIAWLVVDARRLSLQAYGMVYLGGLSLWLWLRLIEPNSGVVGLLASSLTIAYLASYLPIFVWLGRIGRRVLKVPTYVWLPLLWCTLEWVRSNLFGGFALGLLGHAVVDTRKVLQLTDLAGTLGLGALMVASGASVAEIVWLTARLRRLERRIAPPSIDADVEPSSDAFTAAGQIGTSGFLGRHGRGRRLDKSKTQESLEAAVRRHRDRTRDYHLTLATLAVVVVAGVLIFANWYGAVRIDQTRLWKMFESNLFVITPVGGRESLQEFERLASRRGGGLVVTAVSHSVEPPSTSSPVLRSQLLIVPSQGNEGVSEWFAKLALASGASQSVDLGPQRAERSWWQRLWRSGAPRPVPLKVFPEAVPVRILPRVATSATVEQTVNDSLRLFHAGGKSVDAVVLTIEPGGWDGASWPRLMTRSVMAAAVANRCPVIVFVPEEYVAVATGDGELWWSGEVDTAAIPGNVETSGQFADGVFNVMSMIDPRSSNFVRTGEVPFYIVAFVMLIIVCWGLADAWSERTSARLTTT